MSAAQDRARELLAYYDSCRAREAVPAVTADTTDVIRDLLAELDQAHTWDGLMALLDEPGPRIVSLLRLVDSLRVERDQARAKLDSGCRCTIETGCGESTDAGCPACIDADVYEPCPVFGFMCWPTDQPCECCTPTQQAMTRQYYERRGLRAERDAALATLAEVREVADNDDLDVLPKLVRILIALDRGPR